MGRTIDPVPGGTPYCNEEPSPYPPDPGDGFLLSGHDCAATERSLRNEPKLVALATEHGFPHFVGSGTCFRGWAMLAGAGSIEEAISRMRWGLATKRATGAEIKVPYYLGLLAEAHRRANRTADAINLLNEALELAERTDERWYEAELYRLMAEVLSTHRIDTMPNAGCAARFERRSNRARSLGIARCHHHGPPLARSRRAHRRPRPARADL